MFKSYVVYMYYLCLIKREDFNPELEFRIKLFCDWTPESSTNFERKSVCPCVYGLKRDQIIDLIKNLSSKEDKIKEHINKVCYLSQDKKEYQVEH